MSISNNKLNKAIKEVEKVSSIDHLAAQLNPLSQEEIAQLESGSFDNAHSEEGRGNRLSFLKEKKDNDFDFIGGNKTIDDLSCLEGNIENFIGMAQVPIGIAGPLMVNGIYANQDYYIPLATTEGALVASYNRGMKACRLSGGITSVCLVEGVQRSPYFKFETITVAGQFIKWIHQHTNQFHDIVSQTSKFAELSDIKTNLEGNAVILTFEYTTGDASGQNMVTICSDQICKYILKNFNHTPLEWYIESNYSGDKKATALSFSNVRGKKVSAEVVLEKTIVEKVLKTTPERIAKYWQSSTLAVIQSGAIGAQGHIANGLTAMFIACGQDVACISESSVGITRMEVNGDGNLYVSVTLPSLIVGTVGGGTNLPTQKECLTMLDCIGHDSAKKFAEICCAVALTGEISIAAAMSVDHFTSAHQNLGRKK